MLKIMPIKFNYAHASVNFCMLQYKFNTLAIARYYLTVTLFIIVVSYIAA